MFNFESFKTTTAEEIVEKSREYADQIAAYIQPQEAKDFYTRTTAAQFAVAGAVARHYDAAVEQMTKQLKAFVPSK